LDTWGASGAGFALVLRYGTLVVRG
jgi:hypothetical protein